MLIAVVAGGYAVLEGVSWLRGSREANREILFAVHSALQPGTPKAELEGLLREAEQSGAEYKWTSEGAVSAWVTLGFWDACFLVVELKDDRVVHAALKDDDGNQIAGAPQSF